MKKKYKSDGLLLKVIELIICIMLVNIAYIIALKYDFMSSFGISQRNFDSFNSLIPYITSVSIFILLFLNTLNMLYKSSVEILATMFLSVILINIGIMAVAFFGRHFSLPRTIIFQAMLYQVVLLFISKKIFVMFIKRRRGYKTFMIIGDLKEKNQVLSKVLGNKHNLDRVLYFIDPTLVSYQEKIKEVQKVFISEAVDKSIKNEIISICMNEHKSVYIVPETFEIAIYRSALIQYSDMPVFCIDALSLSIEKRIIKRTVDIILSSLGIMVVSPIMIITAICILVFEGKPIFYKQERVTIDNKRFMIYKFRSMINNAEKDTGAIWANHDDERVTPIGKVMRRFWIDELPQLLNVLKGDMSLVGPRPERPKFIEEFNEYIPDFNYRLTVKAGVTGLAQVRGMYSTTPEYKIKYDLMYIRNSSFIFDMVIILETVKKIIVGTLRRGENNENKYKDIKIRYRIKEKKMKGIIKFEYRKK